MANQTYRALPAALAHRNLRPFVLAFVVGLACGHWGQSPWPPLAFGLVSGFGYLLLAWQVSATVLGLLGLRRTRCGHLARGDFENVERLLVATLNPLPWACGGFALAASAWWVVAGATRALGAAGAVLALALAMACGRHVVSQLSAHLHALSRLEGSRFRRKPMAGEEWRG